MIDNKNKNNEVLADGQLEEVTGGWVYVETEKCPKCGKIFVTVQKGPCPGTLSNGSKCTYIFK